MGKTISAPTDKMTDNVRGRAMHAPTGAVEPVSAPTDKSTAKRCTRDVRTASYPDGASPSCVACYASVIGAVLFAPRRSQRAKK